MSVDMIFDTMVPWTFKSTIDIMPNEAFQFLFYLYLMFFLRQYIKHPIAGPSKCCKGVQMFLHLWLQRVSCPEYYCIVYSLLMSYHMQLSSLFGHIRHYDLTC